MAKCVSTDSFFKATEKGADNGPTIEAWLAVDRIGIRVREDIGEDAIMYLTHAQAKKLRAWLKNVS